MRNVYTCIDLGSNMIKLVTLEYINGDFVVLSRVMEKSKGIKKGIIIDKDLAISSIKSAIDKMEKEINLSVKKILCLIPGYCAYFNVLEGSINLDDGKVSKEDITRILQSVVSGKIDSDKILINIEPVVYNIDGVDYDEVLDRAGNILSLKAVASSVDKRVVAPFLDLFKTLNIEVVDIAFSTVGDYEMSSNNEKNSSTSAVINIGHDKTEIGIFNKGILINTDVINVGSKLVEKDLAYIYNLDRKTAHYLKEKFASSNTRYSDAYETIEIVNKYGENIKLNQLETSEVVEARLVDIIKQAKKQINVLTNKEIRYIIITGGISELLGFKYILDNIFGRCASIITIKEIGIRSNSFSSSAGFIKYFSKKLLSRGKSYSMYNLDELNNITKKKTTSESGLGGILNYFTGNKED